MDRFLHHAEIITITGKSYRLSHRHGSADKSNQAKAPLESKKSEKDSKPAKAPTGSTAENKEAESQ